MAPFGVDVGQGTGKGRVMGKQEAHHFILCPDGPPITTELSTTKNPALSHSEILDLLKASNSHGRPLSEFVLPLAPYLLSIDSNNRLKSKPPPDIFGYNVGPFLVSSQFRSVVEAFEPRLHDFVPLAVTSVSTKQVFEGFSIFIPRQYLDCIIVEKTHDQIGRLGYFTSGSVCTLRRSVIGGHHFWRGNNQMHKGKQYAFRGRYFCSDEFLSKAKSKGLTGFISDRNIEIVAE